MIVSATSPKIEQRSFSPAFIFVCDFSKAESGVWLLSWRHGERLTVELMVEGNLSYRYLFRKQIYIYS